MSESRGHPGRAVERRCRKCDRKIVTQAGSQADRDRCCPPCARS